MTARFLMILGGLAFVGIQQGLEPRVRNPDPVVQVIVAQDKYCVGGTGVGSIERQSPDTVTLRLKVRLYYRNITAMSLILPTYHELSALLVRSTAAEAGDVRNQLVVRFTRRQRAADDLPEDISKDQPTSPFFNVIPPGEILDKYLEEYVVLPVHNPVANKQSELLGKKICLQLELSHLELSPSLAQELRTKWQRFGYLWTGKVRSQAIEIDIPASPKIGDCSHDYML